MKFLAAFIFCAIVLTLPAKAQEQSDVTESFARVKGAAVYDYKEGVDGSAVSESYMLTHVTCSDGSKSLRVLLPLGLDDNDITFSMDGPKSTLKKLGAGYTADFTAYGKKIHKAVALKPIKDKKSYRQLAFEITLEQGDALWNAMRDTAPGKAMMMIGTGGTPVSLPHTAKFTSFLKSCGLAP